MIDKWYRFFQFSQSQFQIEKSLPNSWVEVCEPVMDNSNRRKQMQVAASIKTSLDVVISLLKHNNLLIRNGQA